MNLEPKIRSFLHSIIDLLCDHPESVKIVVNENRKNLRIEVYVDPSDVGILLGRGGCIAKSIRNIGVAIGIRHKKFFRVIVLGLDHEDKEDGKIEDLEKRREHILELRGHPRDK